MKQVIIIIRHGEDALEWAPSDSNVKWDEDKTKWSKWKETNEDWPDYHYDSIYNVDSKGALGKKKSKISVSRHGLSGDWKFTDWNGKENDGRKTKHGDNKDGNGTPPWGEKQAIALSENLDAFLAKWEYSPIKRIIVKDPVHVPNTDQPTPNPLDTVFPYLKKNGAIDLWLIKSDNGKKGHLDNGLKFLLGNDRTLETGYPEAPHEIAGSTLICWTGDSLAGKDGILASLSKFYGTTDFDYKNHESWQIKRCESVFVFTAEPWDDIALELYDFKYKTGDFEPSAKYPRVRNPYEKDR